MNLAINSSMTKRIAKDGLNTVETKYHIYGDESILGDTVIYGIVIIPVERLAYVENCLNNIKKKYGIPEHSKIHCKTLFHNDARTRTVWKHFSFDMVSEFLFEITSNLAGHGLAIRVGHAEKLDIVHPFQASGNHPPMVISNLKQLIPFAYMGAVGQIINETNCDGQYKLWTDPNGDLIPWFGKRRQTGRTFEVHIFDFQKKLLQGTIIPENIDTKERPACLELADILAYCAARALSNKKEKIRLSDRICESIYNSMNPSIGRLRQFDLAKLCLSSESEAKIPVEISESYIETKEPRNCWAFSLGGCSNQLSDEHIIPATFFESPGATACGFDSTGDETRTLAADDFTAKILCVNHHSQLLKLDEEMEPIRKSLKRFMISISTDKDDAFEYTINGSIFERWLLKTTINFIRCSPVKYKDFWPNYYLVELVFGKTKFDYSSGMGLYTVPPNLCGNAIAFSSSVSVTPVILTLEGMSTMLGSLISVYGMPFFLNTIDPLTENLGGLDVNGHNLIEKKFYHPPFIPVSISRNIATYPRLFFK